MNNQQWDTNEIGDILTHDLEQLDGPIEWDEYDMLQLLED